MGEKPSRLWSPRELRAIAVRADVDPRSVVKFLDGGTLKPTIRERIARAIATGEFKPTWAGAGQ